MNYFPRLHGDKSWIFLGVHAALSSRENVKQLS